MIYFIFSGVWATIYLFLKHSSPLMRISLQETNVSTWVVGFYTQSVWHSIKISNNALQMVHCEVIKQQEAEYGQLLIPLSDPTVAALQRLHISKFYTHQVRSFHMFSKLKILRFVMKILAIFSHFVHCFSGRSNKCSNWQTKCYNCYIHFKWQVNLL